MSQLYHNSDLALSSALISAGFEISSLERKDGKFIFYFQASHKISQFVEDYFQHKTNVDPLAYAIANRNLKNYFYNSQK